MKRPQHKPEHAPKPAPKPKQPPTPRERWLEEKNHKKTIRLIFQALLGVLIVLALTRYVIVPQRYVPASADTEAAETADGLMPLNTNVGDTSHFIAISYAGLGVSEDLESKIVTQRAFAEQMAALNASGYVTITQQDILDYYQNGSPLPEKALIIIFEDGILNTASLAQSTLQKYNYIATMCTYAQNLTDTNSKFATTQDLKQLLSNSYWELGTNGYRLSYINIHDRYGNFFGHLNTNEFVLINQYLKRDYNHYLMDFLRDSDRLREETEDEMNSRIEYDYSMMRQVYSAEVGYVPSLYILMHSNTGAFGNDTLVSRKNREQLTALFGMNFNRQGSCLNNRDASIYDLTRLQAQSYFSTNHLLMRVWDDTGDDVAFVTGDEEQAQLWYVDKGVAEYRNNEIILTTDPYDEGQMLLNSGLFGDFDMTVELRGNKVGVQSVYLRTDRSLSSGVEVALENNQLVVRNIGEESSELFRLDLFEFDGGPTVSEQEDEHNGLVDLCNAIILYDEDEERVAKAKKQLEELENTWPINLEEGGTPYVPDLDISNRDSRTLRMRIIGSRLSVWLDGQLVADNLKVDARSRGNIAFGAGVWKNDGDKYSQANLYDDVYDAIFVDPIICDADDPTSVLYSYQLTDLQKLEKLATDAVNAVYSFFLQNF